MQLNTFLNRLSGADTFTQIKLAIKEEFPTTKKKKGSSRIVIPISDDKVLKIAYNEKGIYQNHTEYDFYNSLPNYYRRYFAKVYSECQFGHWVIQKKVKTLRRGNSFFARMSYHNIPVYQIKAHLDSFSIHPGDLDQVGLIGTRMVMFDYGLTHQDFNRLYRKQK